MLHVTAIQPRNTAEQPNTHRTETAVKTANKQHHYRLNFQAKFDKIGERIMITLEQLKEKINNVEWEAVKLDKSLFVFSTKTSGEQISHSAKYSNYKSMDNSSFAIQTIDQTGAYLRGNYELIYYCGTKWTSAYFQTIEALFKFIKSNYSYKERKAI